MTIVSYMRSIVDKVHISSLYDESFSDAENDQYLLVKFLVGQQVDTIHASGAYSRIERKSLRAVQVDTRMLELK
jgi:hypothetical protein